MSGAVAVDWDGVCVDPQTQEWLPGARSALLELTAIYRTVIIHTCRANWPEGLASVEAKLAEAISPPYRSRIGERVQIVGKPEADLYIDDRAVRFEDWPQTMRVLRAEGNQALARKMAAAR